jgi:iron-sulfur cluster repair protein YtfE (RIC family)
MIMARGHQALVPLTDQHHQALAQVQRLRLAADGWEEQRRSAVNAFIQFFETNTIPHFRAEEQIVLPLVINEPDAIVRVMRLMSAHMQMDALVRQIRHNVANGAPPTETMISLAEMFRLRSASRKRLYFP